MDTDRDQHERDDEEVDEASEDSFPASDAPAFGGGTATPSEPEDEKREPGHLDREEDERGS